LDKKPFISPYISRRLLKYYIETSCLFIPLVKPSSCKKKTHGLEDPNSVMRGAHILMEKIKMVPYTADKCFSKSVYDT
jgi:hypothetical protein